VVDEVDISNDDERSLVVDVLLIVDLVCLAFSTWAYRRTLLSPVILNNEADIIFSYSHVFRLLQMATYWTERIPCHMPRSCTFVNIILASVSQ